MSKGSGSVVDIIKKVSAVALPVLVDAAKELISGAAYAGQRALLRQASPQISQNDQSAAETIGNDTDTYVQTNFPNIFGYFYSGLTSEPTMANAVVVAANDDILIWDPGVQGGLKDIDKYLQLEFRGSLPPSTSIQLAQNLSGIFEERFKETSLTWSPFSKRYNYPGAQPLIVDVFSSPPASRIQRTPRPRASFGTVSWPTITKANAHAWSRCIGLGRPAKGPFASSSPRLEGGLPQGV